MIITYADIVENDAGCLSGVITACKEKGVFVCTLDQALRTFKQHKSRILRAVKADGDGDGDGDGYGDGDGDGDGYGSGYGDGYGDGDGDGYGSI